MTGLGGTCGPEIEAGGSDSPELIRLSAASTLLYFIQHDLMSTAAAATLLNINLVLVSAGPDFRLDSLTAFTV